MFQIMEYENKECNELIKYYSNDSYRDNIMRYNKEFFPNFQYFQYLLDRYKNELLTRYKEILDLFKQIGFK